MDGLDQETLGKLQELMKNADPTKAPSRKVLLEMLDTVDLSDEMKENLKTMLTGDVPKVFGGVAGGSILAVLFVLMVFTVLGEFGVKMAEVEDQDFVSETRLNIGEAIGEKLKESIAHMDLLNTLQKMVAVTPEDEESVEIRDKLRGVLAQFRDLTDEDKEKFTKQIKEGLVQKLGDRLKDNAMMANVEDAIRSAVMTKLYMVAAGIILLILIFVFFGYKLYKSIKEKEKKREEKKKAKQMKKKK
ncbi:unnamed protein product [Chrysodeixis includens]|uniref:Uncharacterized protein n=1 Tax=Chrysodeixis includens TaxID=689277 RepID=A0A9N8L834_CHRIL|nr:unnamed protein product [Chrysodeixis includens]